MKKPLSTAIGLVLSAAVVACTAVVAQDEAIGPTFTSAGELKRPEGWRE